MGKSFPISRRTALKGLGACIALPCLEAMLPRTAFGAPAPAAVPLRMAFLYVPNGKNMAEWTPKDVGAGFELTPTLEAAAAAQGRLPRSDRPDGGQGPAARRRPRRPRPRHVRVPDRPAGPQDRRRRHPHRHFGRSGGRPGRRPGHALRLAGDRLRGRQEGRQLRLRLQLRLLVEPLLAHRIDADVQGDQPQAGLRPPVQHGPQGRRQRRPPRPLQTEHPRFRGRGRAVAASPRSAPTTSASSTST